MAIPNGPCKLAAISWRVRGNFLAILWRFYDLFLAAQSACDVNTKHDNTVSNCVTLLAMVTLQAFTRENRFT